MAREVVDWRLAEYLSRPQKWNDEQVVCRVIQSSERPILKLPNGCEDRDDPWDWHSVVADGKTYRARFVKFYVNVIQDESTGSNILPDLMRGWFGEDAGLPGTRYQVAFKRDDGRYLLAPHGQPVSSGQADLWQTYSRREIPDLFGLEYKAGLWGQTGVVFQDGHLFLLVTLSKEDMQEEYRYKDRFVTPERFQWQSQNATGQQTKRGQSYRYHRDQEIQVHLLVRPTRKIGSLTAPYYYCGLLEFVDWEGEKPITIEWAMVSPLPEHLHRLMEVGGEDIV